MTSIIYCHNYIRHCKLNTAIKLDKLATSSMEKIKNKIIKFIKKQASGKPAVIGLSGGLDSSVVAYLATEALGAQNIHAIISPSYTNTKEDLEYAKKVADILHI